MLSGSKARNAEVDGAKFRYKVSTTPRSRGIYDLNVTVQSKEHNGCRLRVVGLVQRDSQVLPPCDEFDYTWYPTVCRLHVELFIEHAINKGWKFQDRGKDFLLETTNEVFRLECWPPTKACFRVADPN